MKIKILLKNKESFFLFYVYNASIAGENEMVEETMEKRIFKHLTLLRAQNIFQQQFGVVVLV